MALIRFKKSVLERTSIYMDKMIEAYGAPVKVCEDEEEEIYFFSISGTELNIFYDQFFAWNGKDLELTNILPEKDHEEVSLNDIQSAINESLSWGHSIGSLSDGYHTFDELYAHRIALFRALCGLMQSDYNYHTLPVWKAYSHNDGSIADGYFIAGIHTMPGQQITYHVPISEWDEWPGKEFDKAPCEFDGHTPNDVLERLKDI